MCKMDQVRKTHVERTEKRHHEMGVSLVTHLRTVESALS